MSLTLIIQTHAGALRFEYIVEKACQQSSSICLNNFCINTIWILHIDTYRKKTAPNVIISLYIYIYEIYAIIVSIPNRVCFIQYNPHMNPIPNTTKMILLYFYWIKPYVRD